VEIAAITDVLGVEVRGIDLRSPLPPETSASMRQLFGDHSLLLFRDQTLSEEDQRRFVATLGPLSTSLLPPAADPEEAAFYLSNQQADGQGELRAHSDHCFLERPLWGISLYAHAVPDHGGQTIFTSAVAACRSLPAAVRTSVESRHAVHTYVARERLGDDVRDPDLPDTLSARHPVIWKHPVTATPVLYVNPWMTRQIEGVEPEESRALLATLLSFLSDPSIGYRHTWRRGDFLVWDNIALLHARSVYDPSEARLLYRIQLGLP